MDHRNLNVTRGYYRVGEDRRRGAVDKVTAMQFDRHGNRTWRDARALLDDEHARYAVGSVAVPYGTCTEPSNVAAGGSDCPVRFRCAGCDHFRTDVSYLPDLTAYLDDLLRARERLAAVTGIDAWACAAAPAARRSPSSGSHQPHQRRHRRPQPRDRARIDEAVAVVRKHRAVSIGMPRLRPPPKPSEKKPGLMTAAAAAGTGTGARTETMRKGRQADSARRRQRVLTALNSAAAAGPRSASPASPVPPASTAPSSTGTATCSRKSTLPKPPRPPPAAPQDPPSPGHPCRPTCSPPTNAPSGSPPASASSSNGCPSARPAGLARIRSRRPRRHRRAQPENHPP